MHWTLISRRSFLRGCFATALPCAVMRSENRDARPDEPAVRLVKEIKHAYLLDVSPDATNLCLYFTRHPVRSFLWRGQWSEKTTVADGGDALRIVETTTWKSTYATRLAAAPYSGSFFADGRAVYAEVPGAGAGRTQRVVVDLRSGGKQERFDPNPWANPGSLDFSYWALDDRALLGGGRDERNETAVLVRVELPSYRETQRVPFAEKRSASTGMGTETSVRVSADRRTFVYAINNNIVCRRGQDLGTLWARQTEADLAPPRAAISKDGTLVAAAVFGPQAPPFAERGYLAVYDGRSGAPIARIATPIRAADEAYLTTEAHLFAGSEGLAISPDGRLLAAGQRVYLRQKSRSVVQPTVLLFDIRRGDKVATITHDQFPGGGGEFLYAGFARDGIQFTPDGRYLITSGLNTKVWEVARL